MTLREELLNRVEEEDLDIETETTTIMPGAHFEVCINSDGDLVIRDRADGLGSYLDIEDVENLKKYLDKYYTEKI